MKEVYITRVSKFLPNRPIENDRMEEILGKIDGETSKARRIVLRSNKIKTRYYAIDDNGNVTHNNAQLVSEAVKKLCDDDFKKEDIELLSCGTSSPDQILPSHSSMVHGYLKGGNLEVNSPSGACCSGMNALKYGYMALRSELYNNAVCAGSERMSSWMRSDLFEDEMIHLKELQEAPVIAFKKEFLRWMLSDGAGAFLLETEPKGKFPLRIDWMEHYSYAHELDACMYSGADKLDDGKLKPWSEYTPEEWIENSIFAVKQDVKLLGENIVTKGAECIRKSFEKHNFKPEEVTYHLAHISSYFFKEKLYDAMEAEGVKVPWDKWFINLDKVGNIGAGSIYVMIEELVASGKLKKGDKIILSVPESARFLYSITCLTVC